MAPIGPDGRSQHFTKKVASDTGQKGIHPGDAVVLGIWLVQMEETPARAAGLQHEPMGGGSGAAEHGPPDADCMGDDPRQTSSTLIRKTTRKPGMAMTRSPMMTKKWKRLEQP